ncbi:MAG: hypothetical protein IJE10_11280 [Clostridia bacterium]|nr:hypothetical protein [Clostridia bacterium]
MWAYFADLLEKLVNKMRNGSFEKNKEDVEKYMDVSKSNWTAVFSNVLSVLTFSDSSVSVIGDNRRSALLDDVAQTVWNDMKQNIAVGNGCGMIASLPYSVTVNGKRKIFVDTVAKDRIFVTGVQGNEITKCTVIADVIREQKTSNIYVRVTEYEVDGGVYIIRQTAKLNGRDIPLTDVEEWASILPEMRIGGVEKLPIGIYTCPTSNRRPKKVDGVPITYGCGKTILKIENCLEQIEEEYEDKRVKVFADETLFGKDKRLSRLYIKLRSVGSFDSKAFLDVFDPAFRDSALYNRLEHLLAQLEKEVGTSRGILTDLSVSGGTATEIKRATYNTFALCSDISRNVEKYFDDLMYGVNVLAEYYGITPPGEYEVLYNWSYSLLEDASETFNQMMQARSVGAVDIAEIRQFVMPGESLDDAKKRIEEIKKNNPTMSQLVGE